jgi:hypothetical protein
MPVAEATWRRIKEFRAASPPGSSRHGDRTALISFGIPKLVRFHKIRPHRLIWYYYTLFGRRRRAAFRRAASNARMARLRRDSATRSYQSSLASRAAMSDRIATSLSAPGSAASESGGWGRRDRGRRRGRGDRPEMRFSRHERLLELPEAGCADCGRGDEGRGEKCRSSHYRTIPLFDKRRLLIFLFDKRRLLIFCLIEAVPI